MLAERAASESPVLLRLAMKVARIALRAGLGLTTAAVIGVGADSLLGYLVSYRDTEIIRIDNKSNEQDPNYDPDSATIFQNGQGPDASCDQAKAMQPVVGKYGPVFCMIFPSEYGDGTVSADKAYEVMFGDLPKDAIKHVSVVTSSAGDQRGYTLGKILEKKYGVTLEGLLMNTGAGPFGKQRLRSDFFRDYIDRICAVPPGKLTLGGVQIKLETGEGKTVSSMQDYWDMFMRGFGYNNRVVKDISCSIENVITDPPAEVPNFQTVGYMLPDKTGWDDVVDTTGAAKDWQKIFKSMRIIEVGGHITHDNLGLRPDVYRPAVAAFFEKMNLTRKYIESPVRHFPHASIR